MIMVLVEQLDPEGEPFRTFRYHPRDEQQLAVQLARIERAFHMPATRVTVYRSTACELCEAALDVAEGQPLPEHNCAERQRHNEQVRMLDAGQPEAARKLPRRTS